MNRRLLLLAFLAAASAPLPAAEAPALLAIRNARVVRVSGAPLPRATVVVRNGLIEAVSENAAIPAGAWIIDGEGLIVYPGLIDALSSAGLPPPAPPAPGAPPVIARGPQDRPATQSWLRAADLVRPSEAAIATARARGFTTAAVFPTQGLLAGQGALVNLGGDTPGPMIVQAPIGQYVSLTPQRNSAFRSFPSSGMGVYAYLRQLYLDLDHYKRQMSDYASSPTGKSRPAYDRALEGLAESPRLLLPATTLVETHHVLKLAADLKQPFILYGLPEAYRAAPILKNTPVILTTRWPRPPDDADPEEPQRLRDLEVRDLAPTSAAELAKAGVKFAFSSSGQSPLDALRGVRRAMERGLKPEDALRALTLSAAEIYGVADRLGSVDPGKIANLVITKNELLSDTPDIQFVLVDGVKYAPVEPPPPGRSRGQRTFVEEEEDPE